MESNDVVNDKVDTNSTSFASLDHDYGDRGKRGADDRTQTPIVKNLSSANSKASNSTVVHRERYWSRPSLNSDDDSNRRQSKQDKEVCVCVCV